MATTTAERARNWMRTALLSLFIASGIIVAGGFAAPMVALQSANAIAGIVGPFFGGAR